MKLSLWFNEIQLQEDVWVSGGIAPRILNLVTRGR